MAEAAGEASSGAIGNAKLKGVVMICFLVGFVLGAVATFFVVKNNLRRAKAAWAEADTLKAQAAALEIRLREILTKLKAGT